MNIYSEIEVLFTGGLSTEYLGENIMLVEHMLQCADLAVAAGASDELIVAALLHDIGHLLISDPMSAQSADIDAHHDEVGADWIAERFPSTVSEPVRLHVMAKRYLVSTNPAYRELLSAASLHTLKLQGGFLTELEIAAFLSDPNSEAAIQIRLWDDQAKTPGLITSELSMLKERVERVALASNPSIIA
ncbi:MAG: HD domain-containing protein [Actinomycetes bacterium]|jgi:gamma-butyrobetaine dioxygenase